MTSGSGSVRTLTASPPCGRRGGGGAVEDEGSTAEEARADGGGHHENRSGARLGARAADGRQTSWTNQIWLIRHTMIAIANAAAARIAVDQRDLATSAHSVAAGGISSAVTR